MRIYVSHFSTTVTTVSITSIVMEIVDTEILGKTQRMHSKAYALHFVLMNEFDEVAGYDEVRNLYCDLLCHTRSKCYW